MKLFTLFLFLLTFSVTGFAQHSNLCDRPILADRLPPFLDIPQYFDYTQAKQCQATSKKSLLIYFTGKTSPNSRRLEKEIEGDSSVIPLLKNFILVTLYVDDEQVGQKNLLLEEKNYSNNAQPQFIIEPFRGKWTGMTGYVSRETFMQFIQANVQKK